MPNNIDKEGVVVRKRGKPVTRPIPVDSDCAALIASMPCKVGMSGDVYSTGIEWNAESRDAHPYYSQTMIL